MKRFFFVGYPILIAFTLFSYLFVDANFIYLSLPFKGFNWQNQTMVTFVYLFLISSFFGFYIFLLRKIDSIQNLKEIIKFIPAFLIPIFAYPAMLSYDLFNYIATAKVLFYYRENPYLVMPIEFLRDPILLFTHAANKLALYGIFWIFISAVPYFLSFGNYIISIVAFKIFIATFYFGLVFLIWKLTKNKLSVFLFVSILIKYATFFLLPIFLFTIIQILKNKKIDWNKFYLFSFFSMFVIFILSFLREEIYPWYAIWPLTFLVLTTEKRKLINIYIGFSYGLMLSYAAYMYFGTYFGTTPFAKILLMLFPPVGIFLYQTIKANKRSIL